MAGPQSNPYSYFNSSAAGINPTSFWNAPVTTAFANPQFGLDTSTGKRDTERIAEALMVSPFATGEESVSYGDGLGYEVGKKVNANRYKKLISELEKGLFKSDIKQQLLGLGSGLAFSAASLPFVERLRDVDYLRSLQADIDSPTKKAARDASRQQQITSATNAESDYLRALAAVRQGAASGVNVSI